MGATLSGGRWSPRGRRVLYTSCTASTAVLETLLHTGGLLPAGGLYLVTLEILDEAYADALTPKLPPGWGELGRDPRLSIDLGAQWLSTEHRLAMRVPSVACPLDFNVLLNPMHEDMANVEVVAKEPFLLDSRAFSGLGPLSRSRS